MPETRFLELEENYLEILIEPVELYYDKLRRFWHDSDDEIEPQFKIVKIELFDFDVTHLVNTESTFLEAEIEEHVFFELKPKMGKLK